MWKLTAAAVVCFQEEGLAIKKEAHTNRVPRSQRGGEVVEPLVRTSAFSTPQLTL